MSADNDAWAAQVQAILDLLAKMARFIEGMDYEALRRDDKTRFALSHALGLCGAAAQQIPPVVSEQYPNIPWRALAKMGSKLNGADINPMILWKTASEELPALVPTLRTMLAQSGNTP